MIALGKAYVLRMDEPWHDPAEGCRTRIDSLLFPRSAKRQKAKVKYI